MVSTADNADNPDTGVDDEQARRDGPDREAWRQFGPYLSERQWGTVREDTEHDPNSWKSFPHDHARSRAYRYGEDGIAGFSDDEARMCLSLALWNEHDPILKERFFGLTNDEGNHGEDAKEYWFYLDATPTSSYLKMLYKYPHAAYPYVDLLDTNKACGRDQPEYELLDTGIFDEQRYFDVQVEYAKAAPDDILMLVTVTNRGPEAAPLHLLPTLWFRNTWWNSDPAAESPTVHPELRLAAPGRIAAHEQHLGEWTLISDPTAEALFVDNETNTQRLFGTPTTARYPKDGIADHILTGAPTVNPEQRGTKASVHHRLTVPAGQTVSIKLRLTKATEATGTSPESNTDPLGPAFDTIVATRRTEADTFYKALQGSDTSDDQALIMRQALAGMLWGQQYFEFEVAEWMRGRGDRPFVDRTGRNAQWPHLRAHDVISMPDPWEYPWFAAWDLAFHALPIALVDIELAKHQLELLLGSDYLHPNGQIPAYEWNFDDVNPPVHAWAAYFVYQQERLLSGEEDVSFLARVYHRLLLNFTWWVNRKDADGSNLFEGGFLGLDNIGVFDRSSPLPTGGTLEQADGTAWMASYAQIMLMIGAELARHDPDYLPMVRKFAEHYLWMAAQVYGTADGTSLWDDTDHFFYDAIQLPNGTRIPLRVRSLVGLLPIAASVTVRVGAGGGNTEGTWLRDFIEAFGEDLPLLRTLASDNQDGRYLVSLVDEYRLRHVLAAMLDEEEFLSPHGIRSLSRRHLEHPYEFDVGVAKYTVGYVPADSNSPMFGGNSNWRGPVWMPMNVMLIRGLLELYEYYGDTFTIAFPSGSDNMLTLRQVAREIVDRLISLFEVGPDGARVAHGAHPMWQDPQWRDNVLFYEYYDGDSGAGVGASHQTGWSGLVAPLIYLTGDEHSLGRLVKLRATADPAP